MVTTVGEQAAKAEGTHPWEPNRAFAYVKLNLLFGKVAKQVYATD